MMPLSLSSLSNLHPLNACWAADLNLFGPEALSKLDLTLSILKLDYVEGELSGSKVRVSEASGSKFKLLKILQMGHPRFQIMFKPFGNPAWGFLWTIKNTERNTSQHRVLSQVQKCSLLHFKMGIFFFISFIKMLMQNIDERITVTVKYRLITHIYWLERPQPHVIQHRLKYEIHRGNWYEKYLVN